MNIRAVALIMVLFAPACVETREELAPAIGYYTSVKDSAFEVEISNSSHRTICIPTNISPRQAGSAGHRIAIASVHAEPFNEYTGTLPVRTTLDEMVKLAPEETISVRFEWADFERPSEITAESEFILSVAQEFCDDV